MRLYTVPDARAARNSLFYATGLIGAFYLLTFILGFGAMVLVGPDAIRAADAGGNMAAPLLAELLGGKAFLGFIAAVAFATILAVVAGLTLSGAAALSHDLWVHVVRGGHAEAREQLVVARGATLALGVVAIGLGVAFKGQNVAYMVSLAFAIAASGNFPALVLSIFWPRCTTAGAVASMAVGTASALLLILFSPTVQVDLLGGETAWFPLRNPALVTVPLAFAVAVGVSLRAPERGARTRFEAVERQMHLGVPPRPPGPAPDRRARG
jgi:cation/acetate symporter